MEVPVFFVDAFTSRPFAGNPAAVCVLESAGEPEWMQALAAEVNLSETAFVVADRDAARFDLRWFTPLSEVDLCGHATLAAAHILWESGRVAAGARVAFATRSGVLTAESSDEWIDLRFPADPPSETGPPDGLSGVLGARPIWFGRGRDYEYAEVESAAVLRSLEPDFRALPQFIKTGIAVSARSDDRAFDFMSRFFAPAVGIDEDPVTGSAHCGLGPFWSRELGKSELIGFQASARGGVVRISDIGDRITLSGQAVTIAEARLRAAAR